MKGDSPRDTRPPVTGEMVRRAIERGAGAALLALQPLRAAHRPAATQQPRFVDGPSWSKLRQAFHATLPDDERRAAIVRLLIEEQGRLEAEAGATLQAHGSRRRAGGSAGEEGER